MPFIIEDDSLTSFAEYSDVRLRDQRLFDSNEGLTEDVVEEALIRATSRLLSMIRSTEWWRSYYVNRTNASVITPADIPAIDPMRIVSRQSDFIDLCVYFALSEYILPSIADFGSEDNAERNKISFYSMQAKRLLTDLIAAGDWYDFDNDGVVVQSEKQAGIYIEKRIR